MPVTPKPSLVVIGGGIHGLVTAICARENGWRVTLLERDKLGCGATSGWLRILHGGLRYLQSLDVPRLRESVLSRRWFLRRYPQFIRRQSFLMPLYDKGLKRPAAFRAAFLLEAALASDRNRGVSSDAQLAMGRVLKPREVAEVFPNVPRGGLRGGALWEESVVADDSGLLSALAEHALSLGVALQEGCSAQSLVTEAGAVREVICWDQKSSTTARIAARTVINTAGAWSAGLSETLGGSAAFPSDAALAFNLLIDKPAPCKFGLSVQPQDGSGDMLFVYPNDAGCLAGTRYLPFFGQLGHVSPEPKAGEIAEFLEALNASIPGFDARPKDVLAVPHGLLPVTQPGSVELAKKDLIVDHSRSGGPGGLFSIRAIKYTTAPVLADHVLKSAATKS